ncbi:hypothetical protein P1P75_36615 [Streptomyces sp. ID05-39B]|uniref:hypothetical protein n=1 Tax=Streptomyces sp. ID05-39B TaxID=3028664 RepID=UPI0029AA9F1F|nr:hypothetical protein [Streptomyces sp. ID05-39B]MDX3531773.1 hypothetical protein [Streptomyces sp. ID05-39B]
MKEFLLLIAGVPFGILASYCYEFVKSKTDRMYDPIKMEGKWGELTSTPGGRRCSMGEIRFDKRRGMWAFDGTNYHNDGKPFCHWTTEASYLDKTNRIFHYIFSNTLVESGEKAYIGFGVVRFRREGRAWLPDRGFFISGNQGEQYRTHSMVPLDAIPTDQAAVREVFRSQLGLDDA